jgi:hypothetical protein
MVGIMAVVAGEMIPLPAAAQETVLLHDSSGCHRMRSGLFSESKSHLGYK